MGRGGGGASFICCGGGGCGCEYPSLGFFYDYFFDHVSNIIVTARDDHNGQGLFIWRWLMMGEEKMELLLFMVYASRADWGKGRGFV